MFIRTTAEQKHRYKNTHTESGFTLFIRYTIMGSKNKNTANNLMMKNAADLLPDKISTRMSWSKAEFHKESEPLYRNTKKFQKEMELTKPRCGSVDSIASLFSHLSNIVRKKIAPKESYREV